MLIRVKGFPQVKSRVDKAVWSNKWTKSWQGQLLSPDENDVRKEVADSIAEQDPRDMLDARDTIVFFTKYKFWLLPSRCLQASWKK